MENFDEMQEWNETVQQLWDAIGKPIDPRQYKLYRSQLADVPQALLSEVMRKIITNHTYHSIPTIGDIWREIHYTIDSMGGGSDSDNMDRWVMKYCALRAKERYEMSVAQ